MVRSYLQDDFNEMVRAIRRYAEEDMDQWAAFRLATRQGDVFISIRRASPDGEPLGAYATSNQARSPEVGQLRCCREPAASRAAGAVPTAPAIGDVASS
jgi:hypothetical protein